MGYSGITGNSEKILTGEIMVREVYTELSSPMSLPLLWSQEALKLLRIQEYTGQVRRGYFVKGLSGAQFIRQKDFDSVIASLMHLQKEMMWINAVDPMQPWGKLFSHADDRSFINVVGTVIAFYGGLPVMVFEKQGKTLRVFDASMLDEALQLFADEFKRGKIFVGKKRIVVKEYPVEAMKAFESSGFLREITDYVIYK